MPMIEGVDGLKLIEAFRAGRKDRLLDQEADIKRRKGESDLATDEAYRGLAAQAIPGGSGGGVAGQFGVQGRGGVAIQYAASPNRTEPLKVGEAAAPLLSSSSPLPPRHREMLAPPVAPVDDGNPSAPPVSPLEPPVAPSTDDPRHHVEYDPDILRRMTFLKPHEGAQITQAFKNMDEAEMKQHQVANDAMGVAAHYLRKFPKDQRQAHVAYVADHLRAAGYNDDQIAHADLSDEGLDAYQALAVDYDHLHANALAERRLEMAQSNFDADNARADRNTDSTIGDRAARRGEARRYHDQSDTTRRRGQDRPRTGRTAAPAGPVKVGTKEEAMALPVGTKYRAPDGLVRTR